MDKKEKKIYEFWVTNQPHDTFEITYKSYDYEEVYLENGNKITKEKYPIGNEWYIEGKDVIKEKENLEYVEIKSSDCADNPKTSLYPDFGSIEEGTIISEKALNFLEKNNIKFWKLEKPVKIVNDLDLKDKYYFIRFPRNDNLLSYESKKEWKKFIDSQGSIDVPKKYFDDNTVDKNGIFEIPQFGPFFCNSKIKELLENSELTGFKFKEQKLASEKSEKENNGNDKENSEEKEKKKKGFFKNIFSKD